MSTSTGLGRLALDRAAQDLLFREARTVTAFTTEPVDDDHIRAVYDLIRYAPTALNAQPLRILLVRTRDARYRLLRHVHQARRREVASAPLVAVLAADTEFHEHLPVLLPDRPQVRNWFVGRDAYRAEQARFHATIQLGYFIVGVRAAGLAAGPTAGFETAGVDAEFFRDGRWRSLLLVSIGHAAPDATTADRQPRLPYDDVVRTV